MFVKLFGHGKSAETLRRNKRNKFPLKLDHAISIIVHKSYNVLFCVMFISHTRFVLLYSQVTLY